MIAYTLIVLFTWLGSLFIPFYFCGIDNNDSYVHREKTHFLKG